MANEVCPFISRNKHSHPLDYPLLSVEVLQSSAMDCTVYYRRLYGLLRWTVQSAAGDCSNLPFKSPWPTAGNDLIFPLTAVKQQEAIQCDFYIISFQALASFPSSSFPGIHRCRKDALSLSCYRIHTPCSPARQGNHGHGIPR